MIIYTDGGARPTPFGNAGIGVYIELDDKVVRMYQGVGSDSTNNFAEAKALLIALEYVKENAVDGEEISIFTDSELTKNNFNRLDEFVGNGFVLKSGKLMANGEVWRDIASVKGIIENPITVEWVKGHSNNAGNKEADALATRGVICQSQGDTELHIEEDAGKAIKPVKEYPPLLTGKRWYFRSNSRIVDTTDYKIYATASYSKYDKDEERMELLAGRRNGGNHYGVLFTKQPIVELDNIKNMLVECQGSWDVPCISLLDTIKGKKVWNEVCTNLSTYATCNGERIQSYDDNVLAHIVNPPINIYQLEDSFADVLYLFEKYINKQYDNLTLVDITDSIYEDAKGDKLKTRKDGLFDTTEPYVIVPNVDILGKKIDVALNTGIDIPPRNTFNALLKSYDNTKIKVYLAYWNITELSFNVGTIVQASDDVGVYCTDDASLRFTAGRNKGHYRKPK